MADANGAFAELCAEVDRLDSNAGEQSFILTCLFKYIFVFSGEPHLAIADEGLDSADFEQDAVEFLELRNELKLKFEEAYRLSGRLRSAPEESK